MSHISNSKFAVIFYQSSDIRIRNFECGSCRFWKKLHNPQFNNKSEINHIHKFLLHQYPVIRPDIWKFAGYRISGIRPNISGATLILILKFKTLQCRYQISCTFSYLSKVQSLYDYDLLSLAVMESFVLLKFGCRFIVKGN